MWIHCRDCDFSGEAVILGENKTTVVVGCPKCSNKKEVEFDLEICEILGIDYEELEYIGEENSEG